MPTGQCQFRLKLMEQHQGQKLAGIQQNLVKIWLDLDRSRRGWLDLAGSTSESGGSRSGRLDSFFHVKTHQPTCRIRFMDM